MREFLKKAGKFPLNSFSQKTGCYDKKNLNARNASATPDVKLFNIQKVFQARRLKIGLRFFRLIRKTLIFGFNRQFDRYRRAFVLQTAHVDGAVMVADNLVND